jgi:hypothetical protein
LLDGQAKAGLRNFAKGKEPTACNGVARIAWKSPSACITGHMAKESRQRRWRDVLKSVERMRRGEFPQFGHVYLHPSLTRRDGLTVIDGTRRILAFAAFGQPRIG